MTSVQKFYLRNVTASPTPTAGEKSTVEPVATLQADNATGAEETRSLLAAKGAAQTSIAQTTDATTSARNGYHARFSSQPLAAGTYGSGTITYAMAISESNAASNFFQVASIYFWRPSNNTVVGYVYDSDTAIGTEPPTSETGEVNNITGANVTIQNGDILVLEYWRKQTQGNSTARTNTLFYDGTTDPTDGTATSNAASYINMPAAIPLFLANQTKTTTGDVIIKDTDVTKTTTADLILNSVNSKTFSSDVIIKDTDVVKTTTANVIILDTDVTKTTTADILVSDTDVIKTLSADVITKALDTQKTTSSDIIILDTDVIKTTSSDVIIKSLDLQKTTSSDVITKSFDNVKTFSADLITIPSGGTITLSADLITKSLDNIKTLSCDVILESPPSPVLPPSDITLGGGEPPPYRRKRRLLHEFEVTLQYYIVKKKRVDKSITVKIEPEKAIELKSVQERAIEILLEYKNQVDAELDLANVVEVDFERE